MISEFFQGVLVTLGVEAANVCVLFLRGHLNVQRMDDDE